MKGQWLKYRETVRKPQFILSVMVVSGLFLLFILFTSQLQPDFVERRKLNLDMKRLEEQRDFIKNQPIPDKVDPVKISDLVNRVPTRDEIERFILSLTEIENASGVVMKTVTFGEKTEEKDELTDYIQQALSNNGQPEQTQLPAIPQNNSVSNPSTSETEPVTAAQEPKLETPIEKRFAEVGILGTYGQVRDFTDRLYKIHRIINVRKWTLTPESRAGDEEQTYSMTLSITLYTAPQYSTSFNDLPDIDTYKPAGRVNPTLPDDKLMEQDSTLEE